MLNNDNKEDIILGGNFYGTDAEYGRYDASIGVTLINSGNSNFETISPSESGLKISGNDLITPHPEFGFPGLKDGDGWCVCASWYAKAVEAGKGCPVFLKRTHKNTLKHVPIETLKKFAIDLS